MADEQLISPMPGPRSYLTYSSGNLFAVRYLAEQRQINGEIAPAPRLFVICYDEQLDEIRSERVNWSVARALVPDSVADLGRQLGADRAAYVAWAEAERAAGRPQPVAT